MSTNHDAKLTDAELLALDATAEINQLRATLDPKDPMYSWVAPLAIRRMVADAQFARCQAQPLEA